MVTRACDVPVAFSADAGVGAGDGAAADLRAAFPAVARKALGGGLTLFVFLSSHLAWALLGLAFSSMFSSSAFERSRRWRRPKGAPVGSGWLAKRLMVATERCRFASL